MLKSQWAWVKNKKCFIGKYGTRDPFARDLLIIGIILLPKKISKTLDIRNISSKECREILMSNGWRWKKLKN